MNITASLGFYLLLVANAVLLAAACITITRFRSECQRLERFWNSPTGAAVADDGDTAKDEYKRQQVLVTMRLDKRLAELQEQINALASRPRSVPAPAPAEAPVPLENAVRMARHGASVDDLTRSCGLNIAEARLMQRLHGQGQRARSA